MSQGVISASQNVMRKSFAFNTAASLVPFTNVQSNPLALIQKYDVNYLFNIVSVVVVRGELPGSDEVDLIFNYSGNQFYNYAFDLRVSPRMVRTAQSTNSYVLTSDLYWYMSAADISFLPNGIRFVIYYTLDYMPSNPL